MIAGVWCGTLEIPGVKVKAGLRAELKLQGTRVTGTLMSPELGWPSESVDGTWDGGELRASRVLGGSKAEIVLRLEDPDTLKGIWTVTAGGEGEPLKGVAEAKRQKLPDAREGQQVLGTLVSRVRQGFEEVIPNISQVIQSLPRGDMTGELYQLLLEQIPAVTFMTSFEQGLQKVYVSPQIKEVLGYTREEWLASASLWFERLHPDDRDRWTQDFSSTMMSMGTSASGVYRFLHKDGRTVWIMGDVRIRHDEEGAPLYVQAVGFDITKFKEAERKAHEAEESLREIASTIREAFWTLSPELDRILYASPAFERILGSAVTGPLPEALLARVPPEDRDLVARAFAKMTAAENDFEHRVLLPDGTSRWVRTRTVPVFNEKKEIVRVVATTEDVTHKKELEEKVLESQPEDLPFLIRKENAYQQLLGSSNAMKALRNEIHRMAPRQSTVLITGETGTGKELIARALHYGGPRFDRPFVAVNCASITDSLLESELFGVQPKRITGVEGHAGKFEQATGGTIFLDEIGDMSAPLQAKVLRVLENSTFQRVMGDKDITVDVRVVCATNRDLRAAVGKGLFREDLFYRINTIELTTTPLRERPSDIPELAQHYLGLANHGDRRNLKFAPESLALLNAHPWPGNVRELINVIKRAVAVSEGPVIVPEDLPAAIRRSLSQPATPLADRRLIDRLENFERTEIVAVLEKHNWVKARAAKELGMSDQTLTNRMNALGIQPPPRRGTGG
jgi:PAS domain S-box-containing protein